MLGLLLTVSAISAGLDFWVEPSLIHVSESADRSVKASDRAGVYVARGESESFQVVVEGTKKGAAQVSLSVAEDGRGPMPEIYRLGYLQVPGPSARGLRKGTHIPDVLLPAVPVDLEEGQSAIFWVRYTIRSDGQAGLLSQDLILRYDEKRKARIPVRLEVFSFALPAMPSLPVLVEFDPNLLKAVGVDTTSALYPVLQRYRLSPGTVTGAGSEFTESAKSAAANAAAVNIAPAQEEAARLHAQRGLLRNPLLEQTSAAAQALEGLGAKVVYLSPLPGARADWRQHAKLLAELKERAPTVVRLAAGTMHPFLRESVDAYAFGLEDYSPELVHRLREGLSLQAQAAIVPRVRAGAAQGETAGTDITDGSAWSAWRPVGQEDAWAELMFDAAIPLSELHLLWGSEEPVEELRLTVSHDSEQFTLATVDWTHRARLADGTPAASHGKLQYPGKVSAVRLEFQAESVELAEVLINEGLLPAPGPANRVEPWLLMRPGVFPTSDVDAHPVELRMAPWVAWHQNFDGLVGLFANDWDAAWREQSPTPLVWESETNAGAVLFYPTTEGVLGSARAERLRDGLEDYEYLDLFAAAVAEGTVQRDAAAQSLIAKIFFGPRPMLSELESMQEYVVASRVAIGRALSEVARKAE